MVSRGRITFFVGCSFFVLTSANCVADRVRNVQLGERCYAVPGRYLLPTSDFVALPAVDSSVPELRLRIPLDEIGVQQAIRSGVQIQGENSIEAVVTVPNLENIQTARSGEFYRDLWESSGDYSENRLGRLVVYDSESKLYRVSYRAIQEAWRFVDIDPSKVRSGLPEANRVVGQCRSSDFNYRCLHTAFKDEVAIQYWIGSEIAQFKTIDEFVFRKLIDWRSGLVGETCARD